MVTYIRVIERSKIGTLPSKTVLKSKQQFSRYRHFCRKYEKALKLSPKSNHFYGAQLLANKDKL